MIIVSFKEFSRPIIQEYDKEINNIPYPYYNNDYDHFKEAAHIIFKSLLIVIGLVIYVIRIMQAIIDYLIEYFKNVGLEEYNENIN